MFRLLSLFAALALSISVQAQVLIFTHVHNRTDFIKIQCDTLKKFFLNDYKFVVFNDGRTDSMAQEIYNTCAQLNIQCVRIPQEIHSRPYLYRLPHEDYQHPCVRCANVVQYSLDTLGFNHDDIVMIIDSDMFLIKPFSAREFMTDHQLAGVKQNRGEIIYLWNGLLCFDMKALPNKHSIDFNCGRVNDKPVDVGGQTYHYIKNNPEVKIHYINCFYSGNSLCDSCKSTNQQLCTHNTETLRTEGFDDNQILFLHSAGNVEFFHNNSFLHYRGGQNWDNQSQKYHQMKTVALNTYLTTILEEKGTRQN
jgi:hypothetical protein